MGVESFVRGIALALALSTAPACESPDERADGGADAGTGPDADTDSDSDGDSDSDSDSDADTDSFNEMPPCEYDAGMGCYEGSFTISDESDVASFAGETCISGTLLIRSGDLAAVTLPALTVACHVAVVDDWGLISLSLDGLGRVDGNLALYNSGSLDNVSMGSLEDVGGDFSVYDIPVENMSGFESLQRVGGSLTYTNAGDLTSLSGLDSLSEIGGELYFRSCSALESLDGLDALVSIGGGGTFDACPQLGDICAVGAVVDWSGGLRIEHSPVADIECLEGLATTTEMAALDITGSAISSLDGLGALSAVGGDLLIRENDDLVSMDGLAGLTSVGGGIIIRENPLVQEVAFPSLASIGNSVYLVNLPSVSAIRIDSLPWVRDLEVNSCTSLATLAAPSLAEIDGLLSVVDCDLPMGMDFTSLTSIGSLDLYFNPSLTSLDGLAALQSLEYDLNCQENPSLPTCEATELRDRLIDNGWTGDANIEFNLPDECGE